MDQTGSRLTVAEKVLLERSFDTQLTRRRVRLVVMSGLLLVGALVVTAPIIASWEALLFFTVAYILVTTWERVGYARTILAYKGLVVKLAAQAGGPQQGDDEVPPVS